MEVHEHAREQVDRNVVRKPRPNSLHLSVMFPSEKGKRFLRVWKRGSSSTLEFEGVSVSRRARGSFFCCIEETVDALAAHDTGGERERERERVREREREKERERVCVRERERERQTDRDSQTSTS